MTRSRFTTPVAICSPPRRLVRFSSRNLKLPLTTRLELFFPDASTGRFFVSVVEIDLDPATGNFLPASVAKSHFLVAVSADNNPFHGFNVFSLDTTNDGDARFGACPCFGDQPLVGFDANGYYVSTNAFSLSTMTFRGAQLYAISKTALETTPPSGTPI